MADAARQLDPQPEARAARAGRLAAPALVLAAGLVMIAWTWRRCPDPVVDFGRELYVPWRISEGQVLYRDLNYFNGPLSPYVNASLFELFGAGIRTLKLANAAIILLVALLLYRMLREMGDRITAAAAGIVFTTVFACGQLTRDASFNWLTPYSHDLTHGVALSLAMVASLWRYNATCRTRWLAASGALLGLVSLTKAEVFLAALVAAGGGLAATGLLSRPGGRAAGRAALWFIVPALLPPALATLLLWRAVPLPEALSGVAGAWRWFGDARLLRISYFRWLMGIDDPVRNFMNMFLWVGWYGAVLLPALLVAAALRRQSRAVLVAAGLIVVAAILVVLGVSAPRLPWAMIARPLPLILVVIIVALALSLGAPRPPSPQRLVLALTLALFSLALLLRMILRVNVHHYGFALAMPGMMCLVVALAAWAPRWAARSPPAQGVARAAVLAALAVWVGAMLFTSRQWMARRTHLVGTGADQFLADGRGEVIERARRAVLHLSRPDETLLTLPEGTMLTFLARRVNPTRYQNFMPAEVMMFQEARMLADLEAHPPDWIALVHADTSIYDAQYFGRDYGRRVAAWIRLNYQPAERVGAMPFTSDEFGIRIMKRTGAAREASR